MRAFVSCTLILLFFSFTASAVEQEWVLSGTFVSDQYKHAMFIDADGQELVVPLGEEFKACELIHITDESVEIQCSEQTHKVSLRASIGDLSLQAQNDDIRRQSKIITLAKQELSEYVKQRQKLVSEIAFQPVMQEQKLKGYEISKVRPNTYAASLGLYNGDIVTAVNGVSASQVTEFFQMVNELEHAPQVSIQVDRYGHSLDMTYLIQ